VLVSEHLPFFIFILSLELTAFSVFQCHFFLLLESIGHAIHKDTISDERSMTPDQISDTKQNSSAPTKKLGFGLIGSGKRTSVPSVFAQDDDENDDAKRIRQLVPIDYSTEELQAVQANSSSERNILAAAEFAKRISVSNPKEEKTETEKDRSRRSSDKSSQRDRDRNNDDGTRVNDERKEKMHDREKDKPKPENKILDAKQLIDMIPRTKEELFAYDINWVVYDKVKISALCCYLFESLIMALFQLLSYF
jgi:RNA-binding protein 25